MVLVCFHPLPRRWKQQQRVFGQEANKQRAKCDISLVRNWYKTSYPYLTCRSFPPLSVRQAKPDWHGQCSGVNLKGQRSRDNTPGEGKRGDAVPKRQQTEVKVDFPNRHPPASHQGTRVPLTLPQEQRPLSELIARTEGVQARGLTLAQTTFGLTARRVNSISFQLSMAGFVISLARGTRGVFLSRQKCCDPETFFFCLCVVE